MVKMNNFKEHQKLDLNYLLNMTNAPQQRRSRRLGMASMGGKCTRQMWLKFRWGRIGELPKRVKRIFSLGDYCEQLLIESLTEVGLTITDDQKPVEGWGGHIFGYIDGIAVGHPRAPKTKHLFEAKSANDRIFKVIKTKGVEKGKFEHYVQMQNYMGKLGLDRGLYAVINKNTCEIYTERIYFDQSTYKEMMGRGINMIGHDDIPPNMFNDRKNQACVFCDFVPICYDNEPMLKSCRSCVKADIEDEGKWSCSLKNKILSIEDQEAGCDNYRPIVG